MDKKRLGSDLYKRSSEDGPVITIGFIIIHSAYTVLGRLVLLDLYLSTSTLPYKNKRASGLTGSRETRAKLAAIASWDRPFFFLCLV